MYGLNYEFLFHMMVIFCFPVIALGFGMVLGIYTEINNYKRDLYKETGKVESVHAAILTTEDITDKRIKKLEARVENTEMFIQSRGN